MCANSTTFDSVMHGSSILGLGVVTQMQLDGKDSVFSSACHFLDSFKYQLVVSRLFAKRTNS